MADIYTKSKRTEIMASISGRETKPEISVRSFLFRQGFRFRKNVKSLPGKPDIVLTKLQSIIFVHGCFWHGHKNCKKATLPTSNVRFWREKIQSNVNRDKKTKTALKQLGWRIITVWECQLKSKIKFERTMEKLISNIDKIP